MALVSSSPHLFPSISVGSPRDTWHLDVPVPQTDVDELHGLRCDRDFVLKAVAESGHSLQSAPLELRDDAGVVMAAVTQVGRALRFASPALCGNREIVLQAVSACGEALQYASEELRDDKDVVHRAVRCQYSSALQHASDELRANREVVLDAVSVNGHALQYAAEPLHDDFEVVRSAVLATGEALQYASERLRGSEELVELASLTCGRAFCFAAEVLMVNEAFIQRAAGANFVLRVTMLSGRSCVLAHYPESNDLCDEDHDDRILVLERCGQQLGLSPAAIQQAELFFDDGGCVPACPIQYWPGLELGCLNELQILIVGEETSPHVPTADVVEEALGS